MKRLLLLLAILPVIASATVQDEIVGNVRVQVLSYNLVRIEQKGSAGFEDRPTFHVVNRKWQGARYFRREQGSRVSIGSSEWIVSISRDATSLADVRVENPEGKVILEPSNVKSNSVWLPAPGAMPEAWAFADNPRIIPPKWGASPAPDGSSLPETSGWDVGNDAPDVYVFFPEGDYSLLRSEFLKLTGPVEMPPLFTFGFWDSKYYVYTEDSALATIEGFRRRRIPLDLIVIDTDWRVGASHGYTVDTKLFPDMTRFLQEAHQQKVHTMFNDHPEPKGKAALDPVEMKYRYDSLSHLMKSGLDVWWYDRNWGTVLQEPAPGLRKETWGMRLYHDLALATFPEKRPLMMANVDGIDNGYRDRPPNVAAHRYPIQWTGDTRSTWKFLQYGVENAVYSGVCGLNSYMNEDLGGHIGSPSPELYVRYLQYGCLSPVTRIHCTKGQQREPWLYGTEAERIVTNYINLRYRLLPVFYSAARRAFETGEPILRRLDLEFPHYKDAARNDEYMIGDILVAPIVSSVDSTPVPASQLNLSVQYYDNPELKGAPVEQRAEKNIDFQWGNGSPDPKVPTDNFSARWQGTLGPIPPGPGYKVSLVGDDGVRMWLDGKLVVDKWEPQDSVVTEAPEILEPGKTYDIKIEYFEASGDAVCRLLWSPVRTQTISERDFWIPPGEWTDVWTGARISGPRKMTRAWHVRKRVDSCLPERVSNT